MTIKTSVDKYRKIEMQKLMGSFKSWTKTFEYINAFEAPMELCEAFALEYLDLFDDIFISIFFVTMKVTQLPTYFINTFKTKIKCINGNILRNS